MMAKSVFKNLFCAGILLGVVVGCATQSERTPVYSALPTGNLTPTSEQSDERVYPGGVTTRTAAPSGISAQDWELNEKLRALFLDNRKLAPPPSEVTAVVDQQNHGVVRLSGHVGNGPERKRVIEAVSKIPGVTRVEDHLAIGSHLPTGTVDLRRAD